MTDIVDLRSDTFTLPTAGMRQAIHEAEVGNAAYREDPSVNRLEETIAGYFGQEAAVFLPSATMAGQMAIRTWVRPGDMVLIEEFGHNYYFETGAMTAISGGWPRLVKGRHGMLAAADIEAALTHPENPYARAGLIILENTSNFGGGTVYPAAVLNEVFTLGRTRGVPVHIDGARIWNAIISSGADPKMLFPKGGTMSVCFTKGLGAPMGAALIGSRDIIAEARRIQAMMGGVMRQAGFMAAAALYGFNHHMDRLVEDHANARVMAEILAGNPALTIDMEAVQTNILYFRPEGGPLGGLPDGNDRAQRLLQAMKEKGVLAMSVGPLVRLVTSLNVERASCQRAAEIINQLMEA